MSINNFKSFLVENYSTNSKKLLKKIYFFIINKIHCILV